MFLQDVCAADQVAKSEACAARGKTLPKTTTAQTTSDITNERKHVNASKCPRT